jgi:broad specificity phosphatase PhoE
MTTFYICRHGETENNRRRRLMGWTDTPLTDEGKLNARSSAAVLKNIHIDQIVSSDLGRAFATAYIISRELSYTAEIEMNAGLREVNYGDMANQPYGSFPDLPLDEKLHYVPPEGESLSQMQQRVLKCVAELSTRYAEKIILLVTHDGAINALRASYTGNNLAQEDTEHNPHDFVGKFEWEDNGIRTYQVIAAGTASS